MLGKTDTTVYPCSDEDHVMSNRVLEIPKPKTAGCLDCHDWEDNRALLWLVFREFPTEITIDRLEPAAGKEQPHTNDRDKSPWEQASSSQSF